MEKSSQSISKHLIYYLRKYGGEFIENNKQIRQKN